MIWFKWYQKNMVAHHPEAPPADLGEDVADAPTSPEPSTRTPASTSRDSEPTPTPEEPEATYIYLSCLWSNM